MQDAKNIRQEEVIGVPTYILLMNLTDQGVRGIKEAPQRLDAAVKALESAGGRLLGFYTVMGLYDYVVIVEAPDDKTALGQLIGLAQGGTVRTTTLKAFPREEFETLVNSMP